jgi:HlyD family secretion protein
MLGSTGIPVNFGITIALGFIVGAAVAGQTFYLFTLENLKHFGALKAMGVNNRRLIATILLQALSVGAIGFALGTGLTALFFERTNQITHLAGLFMPWQAVAGVGLAVLAIIALASLLCSSPHKPRSASFDVAPFCRRGAAQECSRGREPAEKCGNNRQSRGAAAENGPSDSAAAARLRIAAGAPTAGWRPRLYSERRSAARRGSATSKSASEGQPTSSLACASGWCAARGFGGRCTMRVRAGQFEEQGPTFESETKMKRYLLWLLPIFAGAMLLFATQHVYTQQQPLTRLAPPQAPARTPFTRSIAATGILEAATQNIAIGSALSGLVLEVYVPVERVGTFVSRGDPLFRVDDRHLKAQLVMAQTRAASARAQLAKLENQPRPEELPPSESKVQAAKSNADRTLDDYERARTLVAQRVVSEQEAVTKRLLHEEAVRQWQRAQREHALLLAGAWQPDIDIARAAVEQAEAEVSQISTEIERATVRSPIDGQVLQVNVREGEHVADQSQQALMVIGRLNPLHVRADIDEHDIAEFHVDGEAVLQFRGKNDRHYPLKFVRVEPYVVAKRWLTGDNTERVDTRVLQVIYAVGEADKDVYVGQQVDVFIDTGNEARSARLPNQAGSH